MSSTHFGLKVVTASLLWVISVGVTITGSFYSIIPLDEDWDQPFLDSFMNSFMRPAWSAVIGWIIVAREHGYGGPANWFLTLDIWQLPARHAYGVYVLHYPMMYGINAALYFTVPTFTFKALSHLAFFLALSYLANLIIDMPCSTLSKLLLEGNKKKPTKATPTAQKHEETQSAVKETDNIINSDKDQLTEL